MQNDSLDILKEMLEDADLFGMTRAESYVDVYDNAAEIIFPLLLKDLSIAQIQAIIWEAFYRDFCCCTIGGTKESWVLGREQARFIIGHPDRFKALAVKIRREIIKP